ncbi:oxysterol-binding protein-related protein 2A isoform X2 [Ananas comosus]|uniref:Oxysterol-binding protein-related protein 2A isoform X2 n=1 Tax=Ananas comosus TaxID=4615 RepID=A0A6P5FDH6_ANACO|nr:oxysterol-binding protein-related protein 2A isoform X2 [Ananas comosus]
MRGREMHPLCCITIDCPGGFGARSPGTEAVAELTPPAAEGGGGRGPAPAVAGVLYKWTNFGKGWRRRLFLLRGGVLAYYKLRRPAAQPLAAGEDGGGVRVIGAASAWVSGAPGDSDQKPIGVVHLKISSFRESKSDDRRFYIITPTKTLRLRTDSWNDRAAWIEALVSARTESSINGNVPSKENNVLFSTEKLRDRMCAEGLGEALIKDCEQIMQLEFSRYHQQVKLHYEEYLSLIGTFPQHLEVLNAENENTTIDEGQLQLIKHECCSPGHEKYSEYSTTESSDDIDKQEIDEMSDEDEPCFFDTEEYFGEPAISSVSEISVSNHCSENGEYGYNAGDAEIINVEVDDYNTLPCTKRRRKLPEPAEKEKGISLWSMIKDNVGKDLTRVCLPVYFNEPLSSLQKCFEDLEYSYLLDQAYEYGKTGNSLMRILKVAAFAVSGYASSDGRPCKPFNPLLGETYEAEYPEKGIRFFSEKVSHHPVVMACHCEGKGWKFWGDSNLKSKFWGQSIQLDPVGVLTLEFDDGEIFQWSKVTTTICNIILGKLYCNHHGTMDIWGNRQHSCKLKFKEHSLLERNPRQVHGFVEDTLGTKVATLMGKWDDSMYCSIGNDVAKNWSCVSTQNATLLWKRSKPSANPTRYNLSSFAITVNELTPDLKEKLPPTDSRLRPDQRYLENGEYEKANAEKLRLEKRQRMSRKLQESGWEPRWFQKDTGSGTFRYVGGYWEAREQRKWKDCPDIFGELSEHSTAAAVSN